MFCFTFLTLGDAKHAKNQTWGKTLVVFKAIKVIPVRKVKSDFLEACVRARPKDSVLTLSGYYNLANKRKISPFSSLKISTNPFLFFFFFSLVHLFIVLIDISVSCCGGIKKLETMLVAKVGVVS